MSAADFSYDDLGQSDATDIAPFEQYPTSRTIPGEGSTLYRERMPSPEKPAPAAAGQIRSAPGANQQQVPAQYGMPATTVYGRDSQELRGTGKYGLPEYTSYFQSVAQFRDYAQRVGGLLNDAEARQKEADLRLQQAAARDETTKAELKKLYDEKLARLSEVTGLRERLRLAGFSEADVPVVQQHAELRGEE
jgi:hypothetical protein